MSAPIAVQLYSLRDELAKDFDGTIRKVADMGYAGVETAGFNGSTLEAATKLFAELGLKVSSAHGPLPLGDDQNKVLDTMAALGAKYVVLPFLPAEDFSTADRIKANCERINEADAIARANGLTLLYHNHWWEFRQQVDGKPAFETMVAHLAPSVGFEIDTYWTQTGGSDVVAVLNKLGASVPLLHIKDGPADENQPMVAVGGGVMDWATIMPASHAEWLIVELDRCATDMVEAVAKSYTFLTSKGYAHGR
ncbi:MAG: sugar phosphate isomerase/epimerase [Anaerolineae bacterium]|nr:sugar phosphate isomerase/epimerase [Anaerolineae bacterium]